VRLLVSPSGGGLLVDSALEALAALSFLRDKLCRVILSLGTLPLLFESRRTHPAALVHAWARLHHLLPLAPAHHWRQLLLSFEEQLDRSQSTAVTKQIIWILSAVLGHPSSAIIGELREVNLFRGPLLRILGSDPDHSTTLDCLELYVTVIDSADTRDLVDPAQVAEAFKSLLRRGAEWFGPISRSLSKLLRHSAELVMDSEMIAQLLSLGGEMNIVLGVAHLVRKSLRQLDPRLTHRLVEGGVALYLVTALRSLPSLRGSEARAVIKTRQLLVAAEAEMSATARDTALPQEAREGEERKKRRVGS
jgi:hypothetical protein